MAIDRPGAIEPHPRRSRRAAAQRRTVGRRLSCLARGMPSAGVPARGVARQGKKVDRPPLRADDRGAAGPRPDSPIRGPRGAPGTSARRRGGNRLHDARGRTHRARKDLRQRANGGDQAREDAAGLTIGGAWSACALARTAFTVERRLWADERRDIAWAATWGETDRLAARERPGARTVPEPKEAARVARHVGWHAKTAYESACPPAGAAAQRRLLRNIPGRNCDRRLMICQRP